MANPSSVFYHILNRTVCLIANRISDYVYLGSVLWRAGMERRVWQEGGTRFQIPICKKIKIKRVLRPGEPIEPYRRWMESKLDLGSPQNNSFRGEYGLKRMCRSKSNNMSRCQDGLAEVWCLASRSTDYHFSFLRLLGRP